MSLTSGFYNSINGDRTYDAEQMSGVFDGIIESDGVFKFVGDCFNVVASGSDNLIVVDSGRAWFNKTWVYNDSEYPILCDDAELILNRYDAVVLEVDKRVETRACEIKMVKGTPSETPEKPAMIKGDLLNQYPLAYIYRPAGSTFIAQSNVSMAVGTEECPYAPVVTQTATDAMSGLMSASDKKKLDELSFSNASGGDWRKLSINNKLCMWIQVKNQGVDYVTSYRGGYISAAYRSNKPADCEAILYTNVTLSAAAGDYMTSLVAYDASNDDIVYKGLLHRSVTNLTTRMYVVIIGLTA